MIHAVGQSPSNPNPADAPLLDGRGNPIIIHGRIDSSNLAEYADAVVRGCVLWNAEIEDLRALIEAVQSHPDAVLAPPWKRGDPPPTDQQINRLTRLEILGGRILNTDCPSLEIRITLDITTTFVGGVCFDRAIFAGHANFISATFASQASFSSATFAGNSSFVGAFFVDNAWFNEANFVREAVFVGTCFADLAHFDSAYFAGLAWFGGSSFSGTTSFDLATFNSEAYFGSAYFAGETSFTSATFNGDAKFGSASFVNQASIDWVSFDGEVLGDLRCLICRHAKARVQQVSRHFVPWLALNGWEKEIAEREWQINARRENPEAAHAPLPWFARRWFDAIVRRPFRAAVDLWKLHRKNKAFGRVLGAMIRAHLTHGWVGWNLVRALGRLSILNRVSLVALLAVPVLASLYLSAQKLAVDGQRDDASRWIRLLAKAIGNDPHLSVTLALTFFAAVLVTLGLLIYQVFAPDAIKARDEDEHVRDVEARYSDENRSQRGDGLRRSIERLEDQAKVRPDRHPSFVRHHGDLIWIPPRNKIEWFEDEDLPTKEQLTEQARATVKAVREKCGLPVDDESMNEAMSSIQVQDPRERDGFVPGAERARICIEEGARAEYWLKSRENVGWAWASLLLYILGILGLLGILAFQCWSVALAAWSPEKPADSAVTSPSPRSVGQSPLDPPRTIDQDRPIDPREP